MHKQVNKRLLGRIALIPLSLLAFLFLGSQGHGQHDVSLAQLSGKKINSDWFRYINSRFGLAIDIPARGYRYTVPENGSGVAVISGDEKIWITIYAHFVVGHMVFVEYPDDPDVANAAAAIGRIYDHEVAETLAAGLAITYRVKKKHFYVLSGHFKDKTGQDRTYYERFMISPRCPHVFSTFRITYPKSKEHELDKFVTRLSRSLRSTCQGEDSLPDKR